MLADWYTNFTLRALNVGLYFKHAAYSNAQEYRFLEAHRTDIPVPGLKQRPRRYALVRYREFDWRRSAAAAFKKIVIGPAADPQQESKFAKDCVDLYYPGSVKVTQSEIPYRAV